MSLFSGFKDFFQSSLGGISDIGAMARASAVASQIPPAAEYVTIGLVKVVQNASDIARPDSLMRDLGYIPDSYAIPAIPEGQMVCYLVRAGAEILVIRDGRTLFSTPISAITRMQVPGSKSGGFVLVLKDGRGIAAATQTPVQIPPDATFRTVHGIASNQSNWDVELAPYGIAPTVGDYLAKPFR